MISLDVKNVTPLTFIVETSNGNTVMLSKDQSLTTTMGGIGAFVKGNAFMSPVALKFEKKLESPCNISYDLYLTLDGFLERNQVYSGVVLVNTGVFDIYFIYVCRVTGMEFLFQKVTAGGMVSTIYVPHGSTWRVESGLRTILAQVTITHPVREMVFDGKTLVIL